LQYGSKSRTGLAWSHCGDQGCVIVRICPRIDNHAPRLAQACGNLPLALRIADDLAQQQSAAEAERIRLEHEAERAAVIERLLARIVHADARTADRLIYQQRPSRRSSQSVSPIHRHKRNERLKNAFRLPMVGSINKYPSFLFH
jgi:hypothetical protein